MIKQPIRNLDKVQEFLRTVPRGAMKIAILAMANYFIGDERHGLAHDDPYRQTTRIAVYGKQWESEAQRKKVMAMISSGEIVLGQRKNSLTEASGGYKVKTTNGGYGATITNDKPGAYWSRGWGGWKSWRNVKKVISDNMKGAIRHAISEVNKFMKSKGKK